MSDNKRADEIKKSLEKDIYSSLDKLDYLKDDTFASTEKLANILEGYMTRVDDMSMETENDDLLILDEKEVNIEVNDEDILAEYNEKIHDFGLTTLNNMVNPEILKDDKTFEITKDVEEILDNIEDTKSSMITEELVKENTKPNLEKEDFTQTITSPSAIEDFDTIEIEPKVETKNEPEIKKKKKTKKQSSLTLFDYMLYASILILIVIIISIYVGNK